VKEDAGLAGALAATPVHLAAGGSPPLGSRRPSRASGVAEAGPALATTLAGVGFTLRWGGDAVGRA
jgi:hypothetical protein